MNLIQGQKVKLNEILGSDQSMQLQVTVDSSPTLDVAMFGLDESGKLSDEAYMIFYNQPNSPCGSVRLQQQEQTTTFAIDLSTLPSSIHKLTVTLAIDGQGTMAQLASGEVRVLNPQGQTVANFTFDGSLFTGERAIMLFDVYQKSDIWRMSAVAQGFNGGLASLIEHFGGEVADDSQANAVAGQPSLQSSPQNHHQDNHQSVSPTSTIDLKKKVVLEKVSQSQNSILIDLTKKSLVELEKRDLVTLKARVALVLDASGSMNWQYKNGDVQRVVDRVLPLAMSFDDDGSFECWAFGELTERLDDVTLNNVTDYVTTTKKGWKNWRLGARINKEIPAINQVIDFYQQGGDKTPVYVLFVSDGGVGNRRQMERLLTEVATLPIFWQFVGIGGKNYGILESLDDLQGRVVDNCNFFAIDHIRSLNDEALYSKLLEEFPDWLKDAKQKQIL